MAMFSIVFVGMYVRGGRLVKGGLGLDGRGVLVGSPRTKNLVLQKTGYCSLKIGFLLSDSSPSTNGAPTGNK